MSTRAVVSVQRTHVRTRVRYVLLHGVCCYGSRAWKVWPLLRPKAPLAKQGHGHVQHTCPSVLMSWLLQCAPVRHLANGQLTASEQPLAPMCTQELADVLVGKDRWIELLHTLDCCRY